MYVVSGYVVLLNNEHTDLKLRVPFGKCMAKQRHIFYSLWYVGDGNRLVCEIHFLKKNKKLEITFRHLSHQKFLKTTKGSGVEKCSYEM